jgi:TonB family protein
MNNIIVKKMQEVTEEEIDKFKSFDRLLVDYNYIKAKKGILVKRIIVAGIVVVTSVTVTYVALFFERTQVATKAVVIERPTTKQLNEKKENSQTPVIEPKKITQPSKEVTELKPMEPSPAYVAAEPQLGYPHLYSYFDRELNYPDIHRKDSINGIVTAVFVIDEKGIPTQIRILNSLGAGFDEEVTRLIAGMPKWRPATLNGKQVISKISVPFTFSITKKIK